MDLPSLHSGATSFPGNHCTFIASLFHCAAVQFWCSHGHCRCFWQRTGTNTGTLIILQTCRLRPNKVCCTARSNTFIRDSLYIFSNVSYNRSSRLVFTHHEQMSLGCPQPCQFTSFSSWDHFRSVLATADQEHRTRAAVLYFLSRVLTSQCGLC